MSSGTLNLAQSNPVLLTFDIRVNNGILKYTEVIYMRSCALKRFHCLTCVVALYVTAIHST